MSPCLAEKAQFAQEYAKCHRSDTRHVSGKHLIACAAQHPSRPKDKNLHYRFLREFARL